MRLGNELREQGMGPYDLNVRNIPPADLARDSWQGLSRYTSARIALGRAGGSQRSASLLAFRLAHARARDAVLQPLHAGTVEDAFNLAGFETLRLPTAAPDRATFLLRPDLGRTLMPAAHKALEQARPAWGRRDLAIIVSDGLSALAAERHALPVVQHLVPRLRAAGWTVYPVFIVPFGRVKLQDEIGSILCARHALMLLGERPGLGAPDSLGAYFTYEPRFDRTDADRNCLSNIRPEGLAPAAAAHKLSVLLQESARISLSGIGLKDTGPGPTPLAEAS